MKKSEEKASSSGKYSQRFNEYLARLEKNLKKHGVDYQIEDMGDQYTVMFNPPKDLVEKMRKAKQEEAAKKKK
jgi:hypothetical protein